MVFKKKTHARMKIKEYCQVSCVKGTNSATLNLILYLFTDTLSRANNKCVPKELISDKGYTLI